MPGAVATSCSVARDPELLSLQNRENSEPIHLSFAA